MGEHINDKSCWCEPYLLIGDEESGVWVHREMGEIPPLGVLAEAIAVWMSSDEEEDA